ncbi:hypothetical protein OF83DRAFT_1124558 [Amylostereum chailletii]|nr:hypothetical protein OF83DRAFT_1124558 [Amylostereum chailletii]
MTAFVAPLPPDDPHTADPHAATFAVRYFTTTRQVPLCVHATLVAAKAIFASSTSTSPLVSPTTTTLRFITASTAVTARLVPGPPAGVEVGVSYATLVPLPDTDPRGARLRAAVSKALPPGVDIVFAGGGEGPFEDYALVEIDTPDLGAVNVDKSALLDSGFVVHVLTAPPARPSTATATPDHAFESRMFAPAAGVPEDPVCGSAHCLLAPYWSAKLALEAGTDVRAKQVSWRGGDLGLTMESGTGVLRLRGEARIVMRGEVLL